MQKCRLRMCQSRIGKLIKGIKRHLQPYDFRNNRPRLVILLVGLNNNNLTNNCWNPDTIESVNSLTKSRSSEAYKKPVPKTAINPHFWGFRSWSFTIKGIGMTMMTRSVSRLKAPMAMVRCVISTHDEVKEKCQVSYSFLQSKAIKKKNVRQYTTVNAIIA